MHNYKDIIKLILANIICLLLSTNSVIAATWAIVKADRAKVYSDVQMSSVIGYIKQGKRIKVGEVPKNKGRLLPIVVSNRIAYIEIRNLQYGEKVDNVKSIVQRYKDKEFALKPTRRLALFSGTYIGVIDNQGFDDVLSEDIIFYSVGLRGYYHDPIAKKSYRVTLGSSFAEENEASFQLVDLAIAFDIGGLKSSYVDFLFFGGPVIAPYSEYKQGDDFKITGQAAGLEAGIEVRFSIAQNVSLHIDANYQFLKFFNMDLPDNNFYPDEFDSSVNGVKILGTLSYKY